MPQLDAFAFLTEVFWVSFVFLIFRYCLLEFILPFIKEIFIFRFYVVNIYFKFYTNFNNLFFFSNQLAFLVFSFISSLYEAWFYNFIKVYQDFYFFLNTMHLFNEVDENLHLLFSYYNYFFNLVKSKIYYNSIDLNLDFKIANKSSK